MCLQCPSAETLSGRRWRVRRHDGCLDDKRNDYAEPQRKLLLQCRDLLQTDLKLLTSAMQEGEERFRLVANAAPVLIWTSGPDKLCDYFKTQVRFISSSAI